MPNAFLRFATIGALNTLNYFILYFLFIEWLVLPYIFAHVFASLISMLGAYFLHVFFTFHTKPNMKSFLFFPLSQLASIGLQVILLFIFVQVLGVSEKWAPVIVLVIIVPLTYQATGKVIRSGLSS